VRGFGEEEAEEKGARGGVERKLKGRGGWTICICIWLDNKEREIR
jgi:hypothetical protein